MATAATASDLLPVLGWCLEQQLRMRGFGETATHGAPEPGKRGGGGSRQQPAPCQPRAIQHEAWLAEPRRAGLDFPAHPYRSLPCRQARIQQTVSKGPKYRGNGDLSARRGSCPPPPSPVSAPECRAGLSPRTLTAPLRELSGSPGQRKEKKATTVGNCGFRLIHALRISRGMNPVD